MLNILFQINNKTARVLLILRLKKIRKDKMLTQETLAEMIGIEVPSLSNIETGKFAPSIDTLEKLSIALNIQLWEFYCFEKVSQQEIIEQINQKIVNNFELTKIVFNFIKAIE